MRMSNRWLITLGSLAAIAVFVLLLWNPFAGSSHAGKTLVFNCAAGLKKPVERIIHSYQEKYQVMVKPTYGGSGAMREKVKLHGGDLYLSADSFDMNLAKKEGSVRETIPVARLRPVLVVHKEAQKQLQRAGKPVTSLRDLLRDDFKAVIANPVSTAVGRSSKAMLEEADLWDDLEQRRQAGGAQVSWVATVNQVAQNVAIRHDTLGIVWDATALEFGDLALVELPEAKDIIETVSIGVVAGSNDPAAALHFARYLSSRDQGLPIFAEHHCQPMPDADIWVAQPRLRIYAGTMLKDGLRPVLSEFQKREGVRVDTSYNGCGVLTAEMETLRGDKDFPDAYVSCDIEFARKVQDDFHASQALLQNDLVFLVQRGNPKKVQADLGELQRSDLKMAMPHPEKSAMGKIFADVLKQQDIKPTNMICFGSGHHLITQMLAGALDVAVVGRSNASNSAESRERLEIIDIAGPILTQTFQISKSSQHKYLLDRLHAALTSPESMQRFKELGFRTDVR